MGPLQNVPRFLKYDKVGFGGFAFYYVTNMPNLAILMQLMTANITYWNILDSYKRDKLTL